jgi:hypothetical protein
MYQQRWGVAGPGQTRNVAEACATEGGTGAWQTAAGSWCLRSWLQKGAHVLEPRRRNTITTLADETARSPTVDLVQGLMLCSAIIKSTAGNQRHHDRSR